MLKIVAGDRLVGNVCMESWSDVEKGVSCCANLGMQRRVEAWQKGEAAGVRRLACSYARGRVEKSEQARGNWVPLGFIGRLVFRPR